MSEVAKLRQRISQEIAAMQHIKAFAETTRHEMINSRMERLGAYMEKLSPALGQDAAVKLIIDQLEEGL